MIRLYLVTVAIMGVLALMGAACERAAPIDDGNGILGHAHGCPEEIEQSGREVAALAQHFADLTGRDVREVRAVLATVDVYCGPKEEQDRWCLDSWRPEGQDSIACTTYRFDVGPRVWLDEEKASAALLVHEDTHALSWAMDGMPDHDHERDGLW